jgi:hypothetical protein
MQSNINGKAYFKLSCECSNNKNKLYGISMKRITSISNTNYKKKNMSCVGSFI